MDLRPLGIPFQVWFPVVIGIGSSRSSISITISTTRSLIDTAAIQTSRPVAIGGPQEEDHLRLAGLSKWHLGNSIHGMASAPSRALHSTTLHATPWECEANSRRYRNIGFVLPTDLKNTSAQEAPLRPKPLPRVG